MIKGLKGLCAALCLLGFIPLNGLAEGTSNLITRITPDPNKQPGVEIYRIPEDSKILTGHISEAKKFTVECNEENVQLISGNLFHDHQIPKIIEECKEWQQRFIYWNYLRASWGIAEDQEEIVSCFISGCTVGGVPENKLLTCVWYTVLANSGHLNDNAVVYDTLMREYCKILYKAERKTAFIAASKILSRIEYNRAIMRLDDLETCFYHDGQCVSPK